MAVDYEFEVKAIPLTQEIQNEADKLSREGWTNVPGTTPVVVFNLMRAKDGAQMAGAFAEAKMAIDDDKVFIMGADGKIRKN